MRQKSGSHVYRADPLPEILVCIIDEGLWYWGASCAIYLDPLSSRVR